MIPSDLRPRIEAILGPVGDEITDAQAAILFAAVLEDDDDDALVQFLTRHPSAGRLAAREW